MLISENIRHVLTEGCPSPPAANAPRRTRDGFENWRMANNKAKGYMLASMCEALRTKLEEKITAAEVMDSLQEMLRRQSEHARHEATRKYTNACMQSGTHVRDHVMRMTNYFTEAELHGATLDEPIQVSIILSSLPSEFLPFTSNYIMNKLTYGMTQLLNELQTFESICGTAKKKQEANVASSSTSKKKKIQKPKGSKKSG